MKPIPLTRKIVLTTADKKVKFDTDCIIDTGAATNLVALDLVSGCQLKPPDTNTVLKGPFGKKAFESVGTIVLFIDVDNVKRDIEFMVIPRLQHACIIGWPAIQDLKLKVSHQGVFTEENRLFGIDNTDDVKYVRTIWMDDNIYQLSQSVYNISIDKIKNNSAIDLGDGVFEEARAGIITTQQDIDPKITHNFLASPDLISTPTEVKESTTSERQRAIDAAFSKNSFNLAEQLSEPVRKRLKNLIYKYSNCISLSKDEVGNLPTWVEEFHQEFEVEEPVPCKVYPVNPVKADFICSEIEKLIEMKVVEKVKTRTITSNLLAVKKKDGTMRCCADNRTTNKFTKPTNLILPRIDQITHKLKGHKYYLSLDIQKAYWSVTIPKQQRKWYTLQCPKCFGCYQWVKMCMGSKSAGTVFSHMIQMHIIEDLNDSTFGYIDDIVSGFNDLEKGFLILEKLLSRLCKYKLKIGIQKMQLFCNELPAFGMLFDQEGVKPTDERVAALYDTVVPRDKKELHSGLASLNYFRNFIPNFSAKAAQMFELTGESTRYDQVVVDKNWPILKKALADVIKIQVPDHDLPMILSTDASEFGLGMVLSQEAKDKPKERRILGCHSKGLNKSERLWSISNKELKGIYEGLVFFEQMLFNTLVIIETDNAAVYWLLKLKIGSVEINRRLPAVRHLLYISSFNYEIKHVSGKEPSFLLSDYLSRNGYEIGPESRFILGKTSKEPLIQLKAIVDGKYDNVAVNNVNISTENEDKISKLLVKHKLDKSRDEIWQLIAAAQLDSAFCRKQKEKSTDQYVVIDDILMRKTINGLFVVCPKFYTQTLLKYMHESLHENIRKTIFKLNHYKIWVFQKYRNVVSHIQNCPTCDPAKSQPCLTATNNTVARPHQCWDLIHVDLMQIGPTYIVVVVDSFSHYTVTRVLSDGTSANIRDALADIFCHYGLPHTLVCDNGANLNSALMQQFYSNLGIHVSNSSPNNSRGNSLAENRIGILQRRLRVFGTDNGSLYLNLYLVTHKINLEVPVNRRYSPFHIMFCRESSWVLQCPDLSRIKREAQSKDLKMLFETAKEIQRDMINQVEKRRKNLVKNVEQPKLKKNDQVRIKKFAVGKDVNKKEFRPFSECTWNVRSVNPFTNTCLVMENVEDGFQPRQRRIHARFLRKITPVISNKGDDLLMTDHEEPGEEPILSEANGDKINKETNDYDNKLEEETNEYNDKIGKETNNSKRSQKKTRKNRTKTIQPARRNNNEEQVSKRRNGEHSRHHMKLRNRS